MAEFFKWLQTLPDWAEMIAIAVAIIAGVSLAVKRSEKLISAVVRRIPAFVPDHASCPIRDDIWDYGVALGEYIHKRGRWESDAVREIMPYIEQRLLEMTENLRRIYYRAIADRLPDDVHLMEHPVVHNYNLLLREIELHVIRDRARHEIKAVNFAALDDADFQRKVQRYQDYFLALVSTYFDDVYRHHEIIDRDELRRINAPLFPDIKALIADCFAHVREVQRRHWAEVCDLKSKCVMVENKFRKTKKEV